jgi:hypothetical protein
MFFKKLVTSFLLSVFMVTSLAAQQSGHGVVGHPSSRPIPIQRPAQHPAAQPSRPKQSPKQKPSDRPRESDKPRRDPRTLDRDTHHRYEHKRERDGRVQICFESYWFVSPYQAWPEWIYTEEIYVVMGPENIWFVYCYGNPGLMVQVVFIE